MLARSQKILRVEFVGIEGLEFALPMLLTVCLSYLFQSTVFIVAIIQQFNFAPGNGNNQNHMSRNLRRSVCSGESDIASAGVCMRVWCHGAHLMLLEVFIIFACLLCISWEGVPVQDAHIKKTSFVQFLNIFKIVDKFEQEKTYFFYNTIYETPFPRECKIILYNLVTWSL